MKVDIASISNFTANEYVALVDNATIELEMRHLILVWKDQVSFRLYAQLRNIFSFFFAYYFTEGMNKV